MSIVLVLIVFGQFFAKKGSDALQMEDDFHGYFFIFLGYMILASRGAIWILVLRKMDLSIAYPLQSSSYVLILFMSFFFFDEVILASNLIGCAFILTGMFFIIK